jgi:hypothetical protein
MASTPKATLDDGIIAGLVCAICGEDALHVVHMDQLPDFVGCRNCNSAFLSEEDGERVFYGQIGEGYPKTEQFALKQWVWLEAVDNRARQERKAPEAEIPTADQEELILEDITPLDIAIESAEAPISEASDIPLETPESDDLLGERLGALDLGLDAAAVPGEVDIEGAVEEETGEDTGDLASYFREITADADTDIEEPLLEEEREPLAEDLAGLAGIAALGEVEIEDASADEGIVEPDDTWDQPLKPELPEEEEIPLPDWAISEEDVEPSLPRFDLEAEVPLESMISPEEPEEDFLSNLRQSAGVPLESEPIPDLPVSEVPLETQPKMPAVVETDDIDIPVEPESFAARIDAISPAPPAAPDPTEKAGDRSEAAPAEATPVDAEAAPEDEFVLLDTDPPPDHRFRVVIRGEKAIFPGGDCAHCGRTPVKGYLAVVGTLPNGQNVGQRKTTTFKIPLCTDCQKRAAQLSNEAKEARLQAHLLSAIGGMLMVVGALALDLVNPANLQIFDILILAVLFIAGYTLPALFLLGRVGRYPPPDSAMYVRSTLLVPRETQGLETAFEWRNEEYAGRFFEANEAHTLGNVSKIKDRAAPPKDLG